MHYQFEWDPAKATANIKKHGISFEQAAEVFKDPIALTLYDDDNSGEEDRWITLGQVQQQHYLVVPRQPDQRRADTDNLCPTRH